MYGSPSSSDDESVGSSGGGAPLWSPEHHRVPRNEDASSSSKNSSLARSENSDSSGNHLKVPFGITSEQRPTTPSDQGIQVPEPFKPHRSFSKSTLQAAAKVFLNPTNTSAGPVPPALNLATYPGPRAASSQRRPSVPAVVTSPPVLSAVPAPAAMPASQTQTRRPSIASSATNSFIAAMQAMNLNAAEENLHPAQKTHRDETCKLQTRIWGLRQGMYRQPSIRPDFLASFDFDAQELVSNTVRMNKALDTLAEELKAAQAELERVRGLEATIRSLEGELQEYKKRCECAETTAASIASRADEDMRTIQYLKEQLRQNEMAREILQDQVNGKRNIWLTVHSDQERTAALGNLARSSTPLSGQTFALPADQNYPPSVRAPASVRSSSTYTTTAQSSSDASGNTTKVNPNGFYGAPPLLGAPFISGYPPLQPLPHSHSGPAIYTSQPQHQRHPSNATATTSSRFSTNPPSRTSSSGPRRTPRVSTITETGSPKERKRNNNNTPHSLVRANLAQDAECRKWADEFQSLFALVYGFCASYFHEVPPLDDAWRKNMQAEADGRLWEYICKICRGGPNEDGGENAMRLLRDRESRPYLLQRVILQHILVFICSYEGWKEYSEDVDEEMEGLEGRLKGIDPSKTHERQELINRRAQLVTDMAEGANAAAFRNFKLTQHHQFLKTMIAPFLPTKRGSKQHENLTNEAFYDLYTIATSAWDLSAKLFRSCLTFQYVWNDAGARFAAETHEALDCCVDRLTLQHEHARLRLCATPAVTVREDRGMTIDAKNILKAGVLVMRY